MSSKRIVLGITGGIATGKTTVMKELARRGAVVLSADDLAHACILRGQPCYARLIRHFGKQILGPDGQIDRKRLGSTVFASKNELKWLERQIHPQVRSRIMAFIRKSRGLAALDIPLLFEAGYEKVVDATVVVASSRARQIERLHKRNGLGRTAALLRINAQMPLAKKIKRADYIIRNDGTPPALKKAVVDLLAQVRRNA